MATGWTVRGTVCVPTYIQVQTGWRKGSGEVGGWVVIWYASKLLGEHFLLVYSISGLNSASDPALKVGVFLLVSAPADYVPLFHVAPLVSLKEKDNGEPITHILTQRPRPNPQPSRCYILESCPSILKGSHNLKTSSIAPISCFLAPSHADATPRKHPSTADSSVQISFLPSKSRLT